MDLVPAGVPAELDRYIGYWEPYATSHEALDEDRRSRTKSAMPPGTLFEAVQARKAGKLISSGDDLDQPRQK